MSASQREGPSRLLLSPGLNCVGDKQQWCRQAGPPPPALGPPPPHPAHPHLFVLLHRGIELLGQVVGHVGHAGLFLVGSADAAFILVGFLVVLFLGVLAVALAAL